MHSHHNSAAQNNHDWRSLFLPLEQRERVLFVAFYTPLVIDIDDHDHVTPLNEFHVMNDPDTRRQALLCVTEEQGVIVFDLTSSDSGPRRVTTFAAASTAAPNNSGATSASKHYTSNRNSTVTEELVTNSSQQNLPATPSTQVHQGKKGQNATCASLIPLALVYASRRAASLDEAGSSLPLRGVMGSSDGRVDVFTERNFVFGFPAHKCPVVQVEALFVGDSIPVPEGAAATNSSTDILGFMTMGADGVVFVWRRRTEGYRREKLLEPSTFSKCHAVHVSLPMKTMPLHAVPNVASLPLSRNNLEQAEEEENRAAMYSPATPIPRNSQLTPPTSIGTASAAASSSPGAFLKLFPSLIVSGGNGFSNSIRVRTCESMKEVEEALELGGVFTRTTAISGDGCVFLVARERVLHSVDYLTRTCKRILTASSTVTHISLQYPVATVGCTNGGIYVLNIVTGSVLGTQSTYNASPVRCLSFALSATLIAAVDSSTNCVELFEGPSVILRQAAQHPSRKSETLSALQSVASADVIGHRVQLEEGSTGGGSAAVVRIASAAEQLLLSRFLVPEECSVYLSKQHKVL